MIGAQSLTQNLVEKWLSEIRQRMPAGSELTATLQSKAQKGFLACFRLRTEEETLSSEARADSAEEAVRLAGVGLCGHLPTLWEEEASAREEFSRAS